MITAVLGPVLAFSFTFVNIVARTIVNERIPRDMQGRVLAAQSVLTNLASIPPILLTGLFADIVGVEPMFFVDRHRLRAGGDVLLGAQPGRAEEGVLMATPQLQLLRHAALGDEAEAGADAQELPAAVAGAAHLAVGAERDPVHAAGTGDEPDRRLDVHVGAGAVVRDSVGRLRRLLRRASSICGASGCC